MDLSEGWKSLFPIGLSISPSPLQILHSESFGPLLFNPVPNTSTTLFSSSMLCPPAHPPLPSLSLPRFLQTVAFPYSPVLQSTSTAVAVTLGTNHHRDFSAFDHNRLEKLCCPDGRVIVFFATGKDLDHVGFVVLVPENEGFRVELDVAGKTFLSVNKFDRRIVRMYACQHDCDAICGCDSIGFLMCRTMCSVHWFSVKMIKVGSEEAPALEYLGGKLFNCSVVADACWNLHIPGESIVLSENGELFLFNIYDFPPPVFHGLKVKLGEKRLRPCWDELGGYTKNQWFSCLFCENSHSMVIVANSSAIFLVDFTNNKCELKCLLSIEKLTYSSVIGTDRFVAVSWTGPDGHHFICATEHFLLLCDIQISSGPLFQWHHGVLEPRYLASYNLSDMRSNSSSVDHEWASEEGFGILVGSFWNDECSLFCYGPHPPSDIESPSSAESKSGSSFYAWELPSHISLSGRECCCGTCLLRLDFAKDNLLEWIEWQQKRELVVGFFIADSSCLSSKPNDHGGFTLIRLMSSGKLEAQRYQASWEMPKADGLHGDNFLDPTGSYLYPVGDEEYKFPRKFKYLKFEYLDSYLTDVLSKNLLEEHEAGNSCTMQRENSRASIHEFLCEKLKASGIDVSTSAASVADSFRGLGMPTSMYEVASRRAWGTLPMDILELAFSNYAEILGVIANYHQKTSLDFLVVPDQAVLPPFLLRNPPQRSNKWSSKVKRGDDYVGPVLPLPVCLALGQIRRHRLSHRENIYNYSTNVELTLQCDALMDAAKEVAIVDSGCDLIKKSSISLVDDKEETWGSSQDSHAFLYKPTASFDELSIENNMETCPFDEDRRFKLIITELPSEQDKGGKSLSGMEIFDDLCPVKLSFNTPEGDFDDDELKWYHLLKRQFSKWEDGYTPYRDFCLQLNQGGGQC
ncbi:hypothetical protein Drorol1_Dr00024849 [Drosera rotundifolia]